MPDRTSITDLVTAYLLASKRDRPMIADQLADRAEESFAMVVDYHGPYPESLHGRDVADSHSVALLADLLRREPRLFLNCDLKNLSVLNRIRLANAAASTGNPEFADRLTALLRDRSIHVKMSIVWWILRNDYFHNAGTRRELERLLHVPSIATNRYDRTRVEEVIRHIAADS